MAQSGIRLVYGGGNRGIMGAVAQAVLENNGNVTGIIPEFLIEHEWHKEWRANCEIDKTDLIRTKDMHERKHLMFNHSDAFVALPGGIGTLEELVEIMTWSQLGRHNKPIAIANIDDFWSPLMKLFAHMGDEGFFHSSALVRPLVIDQASEILPAILADADQANARGEAEIIQRL